MAALGRFVTKNRLTVVTPEKITWLRTNKNPDVTPISLISSTDFKASHHVPTMRTTYTVWLYLLNGRSDHTEFDDRNHAAGMYHAVGQAMAM